MSRCRESLFTNKAGLKIYTQAWLPEEYSANLIIAHGLGEHSGRYAHMADYFNQKGLAVFALDHQGHGKSGGKRGHVPKFDDFVEDLEQFRRQTQEAHPDKPTILFGHSMGALIAFVYLLQYQQNIDAAILSAPPVGIKIEPPAWQKMLVGILKSLAPSLTLNNDIDAAWLSHDQAIVDAYRNDPLVHPKISVALFAGMLQSGARCLEESATITKPTMLVVGGEDQIIDAEAAHRAFDKISSAQKKEIIFKGSYHEIHNDFDKLKEFDAIWEWLRSLPLFSKS